MAAWAAVMAAMEEETTEVAVVIHLNSILGWWLGHFLDVDKVELVVVVDYEMEYKRGGGHSQASLVLFSEG